MTNEDKAKEIAEKLGVDVLRNESGKTYYKEDVVQSALEAMEWKDEQFAKEKKEIDEQWKRLMAESKSIGVDLLQRKDEQFKNAINEIKANIIESRDNKEYYETNRKTTLNWILRLIDECCESISIQKDNKL